MPRRSPTSPLFVLLAASLAAPAYTQVESGRPDGLDLADLAERAAFGDAATSAAALAKIRAEPGTPDQYPAIFERLRGGRRDYKPVKSDKVSLRVDVGGGHKLAVEVRLPRKYDPERAYPLCLLAMNQVGYHNLTLLYGPMQRAGTDGHNPCLWQHSLPDQRVGAPSCALKDYPV